MVMDVFLAVAQASRAAAQPPLTGRTALARDRRAFVVWRPGRP